MATNVWRGDSHYGRVEAMEWCEENGCDYIFGFQATAGSMRASLRMPRPCSCVMPPPAENDKVRACVDFEHRPKSRPKSWQKDRRFVARIEVSFQETKSGPPHTINRHPLLRDLAQGDPDHLFEKVYCARGQAENLIKLHKAQLASDRTSCHSVTANALHRV